MNTARGERGTGRGGDTCRGWHFWLGAKVGGGSGWGRGRAAASHMHAHRKRATQRVFQNNRQPQPGWPAKPNETKPNQTKADFINSRNNNNSNNNHVSNKLSCNCNCSSSKNNSNNKKGSCSKCNFSLYAEACVKSNQASKMLNACSGNFGNSGQSRQVLQSAASVAGTVAVAGAGGNKA